MMFVIAMALITMALGSLATAQAMAQGGENMDAPTSTAEKRLPPEIDGRLAAQAEMATFALG